MSPARFSSLSIVLPARDEEASIGVAVEAALRELDVRGIPGEVLVVDDGSVDRTAARATARGDRRVRLHRQGPRGYGAAVLRGIGAARFEHVFFTDADLQFDLGELARLERHCRTSDVVIGYRAPRADGALRRLNGWAWNGAVNRAFGLGVRDVDCAFKLFHRRVLDRIGRPPNADGAFLNGALLSGVRAAGFTVTEVPVTHFPRRAGRASGAKPRVVARAWIDFGASYLGPRTPNPAGPGRAAEGPDLTTSR